MNGESVRYASFSAILTNLADIRCFVEQAAHHWHVPVEAAGDVVQAVDEAATNIILHGYAGQEGMVEVEVERQDGALIVRLRDRAPQFDPTTIASPDLSLGLEQRRPGGLGIYLIRQLVDRIQYRIPVQGGNELTLVKQLLYEEDIP
jgi:serine/threonine-protein kinase RsbW